VPVLTEKLKNPSVLEAVCELRFRSSDSYTMIPGAMRERLYPKFPSYEILPAATLMGGIPEDFVTVPVPHHRFKSEVPNALVQTGPRLLTVNMLPVYAGYEVFRDIILFGLAQYRTAANPTEIVRVGLRYINHLKALDTEESLSEFVNVALQCPKSLPSPPKETAVRLLFSYGDLGTLSLALAFPSRTGQGDHGTLLDLDFYLSDPQRFAIEDFPSWLDRAHDVAYQAFASTVSEKTFARLKGGS
jgi:uncharacterized protein (TIGR04255 family)